VEDKDNQALKPVPPVVKHPTRQGMIRRSLRKFKASPLVLLILIVAIAAAVFFYSKYHDTQNKLKHPDVVAKAETAALVAKVGKLVDLPTGEQPTVATVSDVSKLSNQTFFAGAKNGDKVLIYTTAKKAILYRPSTDKIINYAPLNINNSQ